MNTLSQRYDDPYFVQNITRATAAGMLAGPYHFGRMDIVAGTKNANGIANTGTDEANHFIEQAGAWMRPGYLLPVFDLESGSSQRTGQQLAQFAIDFSNRIYAVKGIRPIIYVGSNYVSYIGNTTALAQTFPNLWMPRYVSPDVQNDNIDDYTSVNYGAWKTASNPQPWKVWQHTSTGQLTGYSGNLDFNVAQGNIEFVKDLTTPAVWMNGNSGDWSTLTNWNSGEAPVAPTQGPGQVARVGPMILPTVRGPGAEDNVELNRPNENITVTLSTGNHNIRRLNLNERLNVTGGSLSARLTGQVGAGGTLSLSGGNVTFTQGYVNNGGVLDFSGAGALNVGTLFMQANATFTGASGTGQLLPKSGVASPLLDLMNGSRTFNVGDGSAATDLRIALPLSNGTLIKDGDGTLELTANNTAFTGGVTVARGHLLLTGNTQLGTQGVTTSQASAAVGGSVRLQGNGLNIGQSITLGGLGAAGGGGALENFSGNNTWSGTVNLAGANHNSGQTGLNQIGSTSGALTISGVIKNATGNSLASFAKVGPGDVVLGGVSPNLYNHMTRVFGGRLILEKDGALGTAGSSTLADGNTFITNSPSTIAFRAPTGSSGFNYNTVEWIHTDGPGAPGFGQIDNLGGNNTFAGHLGLGGPLIGGVQEAYLGVSAGSLELQGGLYARSTTAPEARNIFKSGAGTLILSGNSAPAPSNGQDRSLLNSSFTINGGTVLLKGVAGNTANVPGVTQWNVNPGAKLSIGRVGASGAAGVALTGGTLHTNVAGVSLPGTVNLAAGNNNIDVEGAGASLAVNGPVTGNGGFTKTGGGALTLAAANSYAGGTTVSAGTLTLTHGDALGTGALALSNGAIARAQAGLTKALSVSSITASGTGTLDLTSNSMVVKNSSLAAVQSLIKSGFHNGDWLGAGITSSTAATEPNGLTALGFVHNGELAADTFGGVGALDSSDILVKYTYYGDADLSGHVTLDDFNQFLNGYQNPVLATWLNGDFDYSGVVTLDDFNQYLFGYQSQGAPLTRLADAVGDANQLSAADRKSMLASIAAVPEPGSIGLLGVAALGLLKRRRRAM